MNYKLVNNIVGWVIFLIAFLVYFLTMAPTASFWDCGEFIACSNELQVPHPPGAPFFLILGRFFALFSFGDVESVAFWVNMLSVISGAFVALFTFWSVTHLSRKLVAPGSNTMKLPNLLAIMGAGAVAALTATFADSVWFNSVEAEVYALSSFFTAIVIWLIFKWEARADEPDNLKWIILIAYIMGLSIGVHLLNLLTVPALAFVYYFKKFKPKPLGMAVTFGISVFILGFIQYGIIQTSVEIAWGFEKFFTGYEDMDSALYNPSGIGMPQGTGIVIFLILTLGLLIGGVFVTHKDKVWARFFKNGSKNLRVIVNLCCWSVLVIIMGYSSYSMIVIRANADTPINENDPSSVASMISYLKREQYGDRPLFFGPRYNKQRMNPATMGKDWNVERERENFINLRGGWLMPRGNYQLSDGKTLVVGDKSIAQNFTMPSIPEGEKYFADLKDGREVSIDPITKIVERQTDRYVWSGYKQDIVWLRGKSFFPRMYSPSHYTKGQFGYKNYISVTNQRNPADPYDDKVSFADDMSYFAGYQVKHMYLRYFMWNFSGRAGDIQDMGWEDGLLVRNSFPDELSQHQGRNHYYSIPLLLGLLGMVFLFIKDWKDGTSILLLFFFTGLAIVLYLNQTPQQPRERDYSYAGSFQTFAFWVGLAVIAIYDFLGGSGSSSTKRKGSNTKGAPEPPSSGGGGSFSLAMAGIAVVIGLIAPILMGTQNWDDHARNTRRVAPESAYNLLQSCQKNGILFTNGDNDTFPLWYIQEVEGIRSDVRVVNLSLLNTDWYIDQMKKQQNESPPLPISSPQSSYLGDRGSTRPRKAGQLWTLPADKNAVLANNTVPDAYADYVQSQMSWPVRVRGGGESTYLLKQDWVILDIMTTNASQGWPRPIYFSSTIPPSSYIGLEAFFHVEGLANRVIPVDLSKLPRDKFYSSTDPYSRGGQKGRLNVEQSYSLIKDTFKFGNLGEDDLYLDDHIRRTIVGNLSTMAFRCANAFVDMADFEERKIVATNAQIALDSTKADSLGAELVVFQANKKLYQDRANELLLHIEDKVSDNSRGNDVVYPMFAAGLWQRLGNQEKTAEYYEKVIFKAEQWMDYFQRNQTKLPDHDRIMNGLPYILTEAQKLSDKSLAARAAQLAFLDTGNQQYDIMSKQLKSGLESPPPGQPLLPGNQP